MVWRYILWQLCLKKFGFQSRFTNDDEDGDGRWRTTDVRATAAPITQSSRAQTGICGNRNITQKCFHHFETICTGWHRDKVGRYKMHCAPCMYCVPGDQISLYFTLWYSIFELQAMLWHMHFMTPRCIEHYKVRNTRFRFYWCHCYESQISIYVALQTVVFGSQAILRSVNHFRMLLNTMRSNLPIMFY